MDDLFAHLGPAGWSAWDALTGRLAKLPESERAKALQRAEVWLSDWPDEFRRWEKLQPDHPAWPLVRVAWEHNAPDELLGLERLTELRLSRGRHGCPRWRSGPGKLKRLDLRIRELFAQLPSLFTLNPQLEELELFTGGPPPVELPAFPALRRLTLNLPVTSMEPIYAVQSLERLTVLRPGVVVDVARLPPSLVQLDLGQAELQNLPLLPPLQSFGCRALVANQAPHLEQLTELRLYGEIAGVESFAPRLREVRTVKVSALHFSEASLRALAALPRLETLDLFFQFSNAKALYLLQAFCDLEYDHGAGDVFEGDELAALRRFLTGGS